jgi:hypothetical protein
MILANTQSGKIIEIVELNAALNRCVFQVREFHNANAPYMVDSHRFNPFIISAGYEIEAALMRQCLEALRNELFPTWIISTDNNWLFPARLTRVYIPDSIVKKAINSGNALGQLLIAMQTNIPAEFRIETETGVLTYLEFLLDEHRAIMEAYPEIIIE